MRTAPIPTTAAALAAFMLAGCDSGTAPLPVAENRREAVAAPGPEPAALPPAPPLWRLDPAEDLLRAMLDGVPTDPETGMPPSLRGLRAHVIGDEAFQRYSPLIRSHNTRYMVPALSREDFREGSRWCVEHLVEGWGPYTFLTMRAFETAERHAERETFWYASLRAKEAVYGAGAAEAACERQLLSHALSVARGDWRDVICRSRDADEFFALVADPFENAGRTPEEQWPPNPEAAARLERWLAVR